MRAKIFLLIIIFLFGCKQQTTEPEEIPFLNGYWGSDISYSGLQFYMNLSQEGINVKGEGIWQESLVMNNLKGLYQNNILSLSWGMIDYSCYLEATWRPDSNYFAGQVVFNNSFTSSKVFIKLRRSNVEYLFKKP
jgi:hypothetical protein